MADNAATGTTGSRATTGWSPDNGGLPASAQSAAGAATGLAQTAQEYVQEYAGKVSDAAAQAKDYVTDKVSVVSDKIKDIDFAELSGNAKEYARQNPGQTILISAGVGLLLGLLIRGRR
jgi:ElaB/YqjD/DUF883 family membrane-anchored ribosome-binding protein